MGNMLGNKKSISFSHCEIMSILLLRHGEIMNNQIEFLLYILQETSPKPFQTRESSTASLTKRNKRSPSPQSRGTRASIGSNGLACETTSEINVNIPSSKDTTARSQSHPCTSSYITRYRTRRRTSVLSKHLMGENKSSSITHTTRLSFFDFLDLFRSFALRSRKDLRDLFEQFAIAKPSGLKQGRQFTHSVASDASK